MSKTIIVNPFATEMQIVGIIPIPIINYYNLQSSDYNVYMPPGVLKHLKKRGHWKDFIIYHNFIPEMIANPDYAGQNPKEPNTIELYKVINDYIILPIKLNTETGLFLSSFYVLNKGQEKIKKRLRTRRIFPYSFFVKKQSNG